MYTLKTAAVSCLTAPSSDLTAEAHEGLSHDELYAFPTERALQQQVNRARRSVTGAIKDDDSSTVVLVRHEKLAFEISFSD